MGTPFHPLAPDPYSYPLGIQTSQWYLTEAGLCKLCPAGHLASVSVSGTHAHLCRAKAAKDNRPINAGDKCASVLATVLRFRVYGVPERGASPLVNLLRGSSACL